MYETSQYVPTEAQTFKKASHEPAKPVPKNKLLKDIGTIALLSAAAYSLYHYPHSDQYITHKEMREQAEWEAKMNRESNLEMSKMTAVGLLGVAISYGAGQAWYQAHHAEINDYIAQQVRLNNPNALNAKDEPGLFCSIKKELGNEKLNAIAKALKACEEKNVIFAAQGGKS